VIKKCANLLTEKPYCYPYGYAHCKKFDKICLYDAYNETKTKCNFYEPVLTKKAQKRQQEIFDICANTQEGLPWGSKTKQKMDDLSQKLIKELES
jgi:hypothetical protein